MKNLLLPFLLFTCVAAKAQYYYKDIIGTKESSDIIKTYKNNKVTRVSLTSYDANDTKNDDFFVEQVYNTANQTLRTTSRSEDTNESILTSFTDAAGRVIKTIDSSENLVSTTTYNYDANGLLASIISNTMDTAKSLNEIEVHQWQYKNNQVYRMLRIKNGVDTMFVDFKLDDKGNVSEEQSTRLGVKSEPVYYYYDANNRLTDIVRFNNKAKRLLPEYMFEYSAANQVIQKITVPANNSDYLIWRYLYDSNGLKTKEAIYDRYKTLTGKIEYKYQRG